MEALAQSEASAYRIGPGRLVLLVGPSGAGKDTLISGARLECTDEPSIIFPRRVVTRPASAYEDHDTVDLETFNRAAAEGSFALWWEAHNLRYGVPISIDDDIRFGRTVVCNVSRTVTDHAKRRYAAVAVVLITAPQRILAARLATRDRGSDGDVSARVARSANLTKNREPDYVIHNVGPPIIGIRRLVDVIRSP